MKNTLKLAFAAAFLLSAWPVSALVINAQPNTRCDYSGYCETKLDVRTFLTAQQAAKLIGQNLTSTLPSLANVQDMKVSLINSTLIINGTVKLGTSNYWTYNLGGVADIDPWWNSTWTKAMNFSIDNAVVNYKGFPITANMSSLPSLKCGTERWVNSGGYDMYFFREECNTSTTGNITWYVRLNDTGSVNITLYYNNTSAVTDASECSVNSLVYCDNEKYNAYTCRNGGTFANQTTDVLEGTTGYNVTKVGSWDECYAASNVSSTNFRVIYGFYGYGGAAKTNYFLSADGLAGANKGYNFRVGTDGYLENGASAWSDVTGLRFVSAWNILWLDANATAGKINITLRNSSSINKVLNQAMMGTIVGYNAFIGNGVYDGGSTLGDLMLVANYTNPEPSYTQRSEETYTPPAPPHYEAMDTHVCFTIRDVCVDTLSGRVWIGGRPQ